MISLILAVSENNVIGKDNKLLWHLPADLRYFKDTTMGHPVIMGRKTFESVGCKPLKGRRNIVVTRRPGYLAPGCEVAPAIEEAIRLAGNDSEIFIAGGGEIYKNSLHLAGRIYLTRIHHSFDGDTFFPTLDEKTWQLASAKDFSSDEKNPYSYTFQVWERKN
jgi:dihydrofolate reductase